MKLSPVCSRVAVAAGLSRLAIGADTDGPGNTRIQHLDTLAETTCSRGSEWVPAKGDSWNYNLDTPVETGIDVDVIFMDMDYAQATIDELHDLGKHVVCYISVGTVERWRDDKRDFPSEAIGRKVRGWRGERWLDVNNEEVQNIMRRRVEKAASMCCDGIEPDNMMVYSERRTGVSVTKEEQITYNKWFADVVHENGMKVVLKNSVELLDDLAEYFDCALNEECQEYDECHGYKEAYLDKGKAVFHVEYVDNLDRPDNDRLDEVCNYADSLGMSTIVKDYDLLAPFCSCADPDKNWECGLV